MLVNVSMDFDRVEPLVFSRGNMFVAIVVDLFDILDMVLRGSEEGLVIGGGGRSGRFRNW